MSKGVLQFDMWGVTPSNRWDWDRLRAQLEAHGVRNSLLLAPMPTASTAQILGNNECFEPYTSNLYSRRTLAGDFFILNPHLQRELQTLGMWSRKTRNAIISAGGSVQGLRDVPARLREVFKTVWEMKQRHLIDMAADRGAFIDQSQSLNLFLKDPTFSQLSSMHFYAWRSGLKTGMYYLRTRPAADAIKGLAIEDAEVPPSTAIEPRGSLRDAQTDAEAAATVEFATSPQSEADAAACALNSAEGECEMCSG
jgi:ribonucleotide reductase alpha subunit